MTGPKEPGDDWGFPEVDPASPALPPPVDDDVADLTEVDEPGFDTGSDAWWRAQADAQRRAAASEPVLPPAPPPPAPAPPPPPLVEPTVLNQPSPLDQAWVPPELPELRPPVEPAELPTEPPAEPSTEAAYEEPAEQAVEEAAPSPSYEEPVDAAWDDAPHDEDAWDDATTAYALEEPVEEPVAEEGPDWYRGLVEHPDPAAPMPEEVPPAVEQSAVTREPVEPQKVGTARALAGAALALLGVLLAIGALLVFNGKDDPKGGPTVAPTPNGVLTSAAPTQTEPASPSPTSVTTTAPAVITTTAPPAQAPVVPVRVLNNSKIKGLADRAATRFRSGGWPVPQTGNYRGGTIAVTTVYYPPGQEASARRFARQFGIPRVAPRFAGIPVPGMTVIVTRDYRP